MAKKKPIVPIIIVVGILIVAIGCLTFFLLIPKNSISIEGAEIADTIDKDGVKEITATLTKECNSTENNGYYVCEPVTISGTYEGDGKIEIANEEISDFTAADKKLSFTSKEVSYKKVVVREEKISTTSNNYIIVMKNKNGDNNIIVYKLEVKTTLSDKDNAAINAEPSQEAIAAALNTIDTIKETCILNENTDPNNEIGKDHQYYIKVSYIDKRVDVKYYGNLDNNYNFVATSKSCAENGSEAGGTIEVFRTVEDAKTRKEYLDGFTGVLSSGKSKLVNTTLIRVSPNLKASEQNDLLEKIYQTLTK